MLRVEVEIDPKNDGDDHMSSSNDNDSSFEEGVGRSPGRPRTNVTSKELIKYTIKNHFPQHWLHGVMVNIRGFDSRAPSSILGEASIFRAGGSVVEFSPATREARVRFPAGAIFLLFFVVFCCYLLFFCWQTTQKDSFFFF